MTVEEIMREWLKGCSCAEEGKPWQCEECTEGMMNAVKNQLGIGNEPTESKRVSKDLH